MFEIFLLVAAAAGISALARGRGAQRPWGFGLVALVGYFLGMIFARPFGPESVANVILPWASVAIVALFTRFVLGAGRVKPDGIWSCPDCHMVNESSYVVCQACSRPWAAT